MTDSNKNLVATPEGKISHDSGIQTPLYIENDLTINNNSLSLVINKINNTKEGSNKKVEVPQDHECSFKSQAPIVGWHNGSPTIISRSAVAKSRYNRDDGSSKSSGIGRESTLALSIDRSSVESFLPEKNDSEYESWLTLTTKPVEVQNTWKEFIESSSILDMVDGRENLYAESMKKDELPSKIPDGGWGWMVVLASLVISMIADGVSFSFGLLYIEFLEEFGASKSKTAWIGSLFMAVPLLSGPVMSALVDRYGCRNMTIIGGLIAGTGKLHE